MKIGKNIKKYRQQKNITQLELSEKTGIGYRTIQDYESGTIKEPTVTKLQSIADALNVSIFDLMQDDKIKDSLKNEVKELETFEVLLKYLNYSVDYEPSDPDNYYMEDEKDENGNIIGQRKVYEGDNNVIITKENFIAKFSQSEYDNLKSSVQDFIEFLIYKKGGTL